MSEHTYIRLQKVGGWDINNVDHVDADGKQITLASEIKVAFPGKAFTVRSNGEEAKVDFEDELTAPEIAILDGIVAAHKAVTGTVVADRQARTDSRDALRASWEQVGITYPYITGPFEHKFEDVNLLLDQGRNAEAEAVIQFADPPTGYDPTQLATFQAVKQQMLSGVQGIPA